MKISENKAAKGEGSKWQCHKGQTNCTLRRKGLRSSVRLVGKKQDEKSSMNQRIEHPMEFSSKSTKSLDSETRVKNKKTKNTEISFDEESNSLDRIKEIEKIINFIDSDSIVAESMGHCQLNNEPETSVSQKKILPITAKSQKDNTNLNLKSNLVMCKGDGVDISLQARLENNPKIGEVNNKVKLNSNDLNHKIVAKNTKISNSSRKGKQIPCKGDLSKKSNRPKQRNVSILDLPNEILTKILNSLSYLEVGKIRRVCKRFDAVGCDILNNAFQRLQQRLLHRFQQIKAKMPRRESARRRHPLARESDIIETLHMRLTLLQMSFGKHIEKKHCCFFAGEILDEILNILSYVKTVPSLGRAYKVTDELFDLTTMAMEYFKEHIEPTLPEINYFSSDFIDINTPSTSFTTRLVQTSSELPGPSSSRSQGTSDSLVQDQRVNKLKQKLKTCMSDVTALKKELKIYKGKFGDQQKQFVDLGSKLEQHDKKFEESACQFGLLLREYQSCKKELQNWRQSCSCRPSAPSPTRPTVSVEEQESPNKPSSNNVVHSPASQDIALSSISQENSDNHQNSEQLPVVNSDSTLNHSKSELLRALNCKRKQNRNYKASNKRMKISVNTLSNNTASQL